VFKEDEEDMLVVMAMVFARVWVSQAFLVVVGGRE